MKIFWDCEGSLLNERFEGNISNSCLLRKSFEVKNLAKKQTANKRNRKAQWKALLVWYHRLQKWS